MPFSSAQVPQFVNSDFENFCDGSGCVNVPDPADPHHLPVCLEGWNSWWPNEILTNLDVGTCDYYCNGNFGLKVEKTEGYSIYPVAENPFFGSENHRPLSIGFNYHIPTSNWTGGEVLGIYGTHFPQTTTSTGFSIATELDRFSIPNDVTDCTPLSWTVSEQEMAAFEYIVFRIMRQGTPLVSPNETGGQAYIDDLNVTVCEATFEQVPSENCDQVCFSIQYPECISTCSSYEQPIDGGDVKCKLSVGNIFDEIFFDGSPNFICLDVLKFTDHPIPVHHIRIVDDVETRILIGFIEFDYVCCDNAQDYFVEEDTEWNVYNVPNGGTFRHLSIAEDVELIITGDLTLYFAEGQHLMLGKGSTVKLFGGLTACNDSWGGVRLYEGAKFIGKNGSSISKAKRGISSKPWGIYFGAAEIDCNGTDFIDNEKAVELKTTGSTFETGYIANFTNCKFRKTEGFTFGYFWNFINIRNMDLQAANGTANFDGCRFINQNPNDHNNNNSGITSVDSRFIVESESSVGSLFKGLGIGVNAINVQESHSFYVANTTFEDCAYGIYSSGISNATVYKNKFRLGQLSEVYWYNVRPNQKRQVGLAMEGGGTGVTNIFVQENEFFEYGEKNVRNTIGSKMVELGPADNIIRSNIYTKLNFGNMANYTNGDMVESSGLLYQCNTNLDDTYMFARFDFLAYSPKGGSPVVINPKQRTKKPNSSVFAPAYNIFAQHPKYDFYKQGGGVDYYYNNILDPLPFDEKPRLFHYAGIDLEPSNPSESRCGAEAPKQKWTTAERNENQAKFFESIVKYQAAKVEADDAVLAGNTSLAKEKEEEAIAYAMDKRHFAEIGYLAEMSSSEGHNSDVAKLWLTRLNTYEADLLLAQMAWSESNWVSVSDILSNLAAKYDLTPAVQMDLDKIVSIYESIEAAGSIENLSDDAVAKLQEFATPDEGRASGMARNVLRAKGFYYAPIAVDLSDLEAEVANRESFISNKVRSKELVETLDAYPNPADYLVEFDLGLGSLHQDAEVVVTNAFGREVVRLRTAKGETQIVWDTHAVADGIYFCHLNIDGKVVKSTKLFIKK